MLCVSIIIPYFDRAHTISRCIASIDLEKNCNVEVIIVDDHSKLPLCSFNNSSITVIRLDSNMGPVAARSYGAMKAKHDYLMFLDSDDELLSDWYELLCEEIAKNSTYDFFGFPDEKFTKKNYYDLVSLEDYWKWVPLDSRASDYIIAIKASAYSNMVMPKLRISEIWYIVQLFEAGLKAHYSEKPIFKYHQDAGNQLSNRNFWRFDISNFTRKSLFYSISVFNKNSFLIKKYSKSYYYAWLKRFIKECILALSISSLTILIWRRNEASKTRDDRS